MDSQTTTIAPTTVANMTSGTRRIHLQYPTVLFAFAILTLVYMFIVTIATIVTNGLTLFAIYKDPLKCFRNPLTIFITGVIVADFLFGLFGEAMLASGIAHAMNTGGFRVMVLGITVASLTIAISFLTLLALAIAQLLATGWLNRYERCVSPTSARVGIVVIWAVTLLIYVALGVTIHPLAVVGLSLLIVALVTVVLVVLYIITYRVFRRRIGQQEPSLETDLVSQEFLKGTLTLVLVQIITVWPFIITVLALSFDMSRRSSYVVVGLIFLYVTLAIYLAKFLIDPIILVWRIPKYRRSMKIVYAGCIRRLGCCADETAGEGISYNKAPKDDVDEHSQDNAQVEVI